MKYKNIDSWKISIKKIAKERNLDVQDVQQRFVLEEFALKIGVSDHKDILVLKGGFIVSTILGLDTRTTRDIDVTYRSSNYSQDDLIRILNDIVNTEIDTMFDYHLESIDTAQQDDNYTGIIAWFVAKQGKTEIKFKLDISNNTLIYPNALSISLKSLFSDKPIKLMTYPIENIIAEKIETTLDRGEFNGRMRDLVDIYLLMGNYEFLIDRKLLANTIVEVSRDRGTLANLKEFSEIIQTLSNSKIFNTHFSAYIEDNYTDTNITLEQVFEMFDKILKDVNKSIKTII